MKTTLTLRLLHRALIALGFICILNLQSSSVFAQGTAFTYQGRINNGAGPVNGSYDVKFMLFSAASGGSAVAGPLTVSAIPVSNGLFVATLDFGANVFNGSNYWLELGVATNGGGSFDTLSPRQPVTPSPYAEYAAGAATAATATTATTANSVAAANIMGTLPDARLSTNVALRAGGNTFTGNQIVTNGNVGIGTPSPLKPLQVGGPVGTEGMIRIGSTSTNAAYTRFWDIGVPKNDTNTSGSFYSFTIQDTSAPDPAFLIRWDSQNVGIGTTNPINRLQVGNSYLYAGGYGLAVSSPTYGADIQINSIGGIGLLLHNPAGASANMLVVRNGPTDTNVFSVAGNGDMNAAGNVYAHGVLLTSDRNAKENFQLVSPEQMLSQVASLPIAEWNFKSEPGTRHIGPMAQDFHSAFKVGPDDTHISMVDEGGVALAAIQGLNRKLEQRLEQKEMEIMELKARLERLEHLMQSGTKPNQ